MLFRDAGILKFAREAYSLARRAARPFSSKFSKKTYTQRQHIAVLCLKKKLKADYRRMEELLLISPPLRRALGLRRTPDYTTIKKAFDRLQKKVLGIMLTFSAACSGQAAIDATGFDRGHASRHYTKRCRMHIKSMKTTYLVDTETQCIMGVHITTTRKHDTKIILPLVGKALRTFRLRSLAADAGYDDSKVRSRLRRLGIRPVIKHREFSGRDKVYNKRLEKDYGRRSLSETVNSSGKRKYGSFLSSRKWFLQFKEGLLMAVVYNVDRKISLFIWVRISTELKKNIERRTFVIWHAAFIFRLFQNSFVIK